jgi:hypothetical protein
MTDALTERQRQYAQHLARGMNSRQAALAAGYSESFSRVAMHRLGKKPEVAKAVEDIRKKGREMAVYGLLEAMQEADSAAAFAKLHKNPMANVKACELRAKLSGLLIERVEVATVDLTGSLQRAEARLLRAINITSRSPCSGAVAAGPDLLADPAVNDAGYYNGPGKNGDPFAE